MISGISGAKFNDFLLFNAGGNVVDNTIYCLSISLSSPEIFAVKVKSCCKSNKILDFFALPNFKGRCPQKLSWVITPT